MRSDGYISFTTICLLLFISTLIILGSTFVLSANRELEKLDAKVKEDEHLYAKAVSVMEALLNETEADSEYDGIWDHLESLSDADYEYSLAECSSRINPNFDSLDLWKKTSLQDKMADVSLSEQWATERVDRFADAADSIYSYFPEEHWDSIYTLYSYLNVRTCPEEVIEAYLSQNDYDPGKVQSITEKINTYNESGEKIPQSELNTLLVRDKRPYSLLLTAAPQINVNFCDPAVLDAILNYPWLGQPLGNAHIIKNNIINARSRSEINSETLESLLECDQEIKNELLKYLGTISWFWKLEIEGKDKTWEYLFCRIPPIEEDEFPGTIQIVSKSIKGREADV